MAAKLQTRHLLAHIRRNLPTAKTEFVDTSAEIKIQIASGRVWVAPLEELRNVLVLDQLIEEILKVMAGNDHVA